MRLALLTVVLASTPSFAAGLSEEDVVRQGLAQSRVTTLLESRRAAAAGTASTIGRWDNPELEYSKESLELPGEDSSDRFLWLRQRFNVAGARGLERRAALMNLDGQHARIELQRRDLVREIRMSYYDVVAARQRLEAQRGWHQRLEELVAAVAARRQAGDAAHYDEIRLRQEWSLVAARVLEARAVHESARDRLFELTGVEPAALTSGLIPPPPAETAVGALEGHPLLLALQAEARSADTRAKAAKRDAWPDVTLGVGRHELEEGGVDADGGLIAIGVELPLFDRSRGEFQAADNQARALRAEASLARSRLQADVREALRLLEVRRSAVLDLRQQMPDQDAALSAIAESAYAAGELDVMALIDAHRTELAVASEVTALARAARAAYIQLQYLSGEP